MQLNHTPLAVHRLLLTTIAMLVLCPATLVRGQLQDGIQPAIGDGFIVETQSRESLEDGSTRVTMSVFNTGLSDGVLEVRDESGDVVRYQVISGHRVVPTSLKELFWDNTLRAGQNIGGFLNLTEFGIWDDRHPAHSNRSDIQVELAAGQTAVVTRTSDAAIMVNWTNFVLALADEVNAPRAGLEKALKESATQLVPLVRDAFANRSESDQSFLKSLREALIATRDGLINMGFDEAADLLGGFHENMLEANPIVQKLKAAMTFGSAVHEFNKLHELYLAVSNTDRQGVTVSQNITEGDGHLKVTELPSDNTGDGDQPAGEDGIAGRNLGQQSDEEQTLNQRDDLRQQVLVQSGTLDLARRRAFNAVDVFFLADNTGSMGDEIAEVKARAQSILDALAGNDPRFENVQINWGVGRYSDDQIVNPGANGYQLLQPITDDKAAIQAALDQWNSSWGVVDESAFWATHQAVTEGEGTPRHPANPQVATGQATGWRDGARRVIILFGDEPSYQDSINEKELRQILLDNDVALSIIDSGDDSRSQNTGSTNTSWDATSGFQLVHAAEELTDGTGGAYIQLISTDELVDAILAATFDAIAENTRTGGQVTRITDSRAWRIRTPSSVEASTPDGGDTFDFTLRFPGETDSMFSVDLTSGAATLGKDYLETSSVTGASDIFGEDLSATSLVQFTEDKDFLRFVFVNGSGAEVEGYYGDRLDSLPGSGTTTFDLSSRSLSPYDGDVYAGVTAANVMDTRMSINWSTGKVFAYDPTSPNPESGVGLFIGEVNPTTKKVEGRYVAIADRETAGESASVPRYIQDTARGNTNLQLYGESAPAGIGGTFSVNWHNENGTPSYTSFLASGFADSTVAGPTTISTGESWQGFAAALIIDRSDGSTSVAVNDDASDVAMTFHPNSGEFEGHIEVEDGSTHTLDTDREDSAFVSSDAFGAVKDENGTPAHIATDTEQSSQYDYTSWGTWSKDSSGSPQQSVPARSPWIAGRLTPDGDVPTSGSATYSGEAWGHLNESGSFTTVSGDATLNANFGSRTLTGSFDDMRRADGSSWTSANVNAGWASGQNNIQGTINATNGMSGNLRGAFFGPNAEEVGGNWHLQGGGDKAAGAFRGKR